MKKLPDYQDSDESLPPLQENVVIYKLLVESVKDYAIFMLDTNGYITTWNWGAEKLKGYTKDEILQKHFSIFYLEEAKQRNHPAFELKVATEVGRFEEEGWRIRKDGSRFWANVLITAVYNKKKQLVGFAKVTRDLSEKKALEDELRKTNEELIENEERSRLLIEGVKDYAIFLLSKDGIVTTWNEGAKRIKGYEPHEIIGKSFLKFYTPEAIAAKYPQFELAKALEEGKFEDEGWRVRKDGTKFWVNALITPIYNAKKQHIGFTKITKDLSERVKNEGLMQKNLLLHQVNTDLDNFIYTASHDLKSPISNLEGLLALMEKKIAIKLNDREKVIVDMMGKSIHKLNNTISNLTEVTKAQKNLEDRMEVVEIRDILIDVKEELHTAIENGEVELIETIKIKKFTFAKASLRSMVYNLLSNAIKYSSPDRPTKITISTFLEDNQKVLCVKDNGLGLSKKHQEKLFGMFKRFHSHVEGSGIGLYILKRTMENYGGKVAVNSVVDQGTEFKLYFPK